MFANRKKKPNTSGLMQILTDLKNNYLMKVDGVNMNAGNIQKSFDMELQIKICR